MALKNFIKENFVLVVGLTLPVLLIVAFFLASVLPKSLATPPQHELLFTVTRYDNQPSSPAYYTDLVVRDGALKARVTKNKQPPGTYTGYSQKKLMAYDWKTQSAHEISYDLTEIGDVADGAEVVLDEFKGMKVSSDSKAPDGYIYEGPGGYGYGGIGREIFWGGYHNKGARVVKGAVAFKIPNDQNRYSYYDFQFLGWVVEKK